MLLGPIFRRELLTSARRGRLYSGRVVTALILLGALAANYYGYREYFENGGVFTLPQLSLYTRTTFFSLLGVQIVLTLFWVPNLIAPAVVEERERKTLHYLMGSPLPAREIVLGKAVSRVLQFAVSIFSGAPILFALTLIGGLEPEWILLSYIGFFSMAFFLVGQTILVSVISRRTKVALNAAGALATSWFLGPFLLMVLRMWLPLPGVLAPALNALQDTYFASSPINILSNVGLLMGRTPAVLQERLIRMVAMQWIFGALFLLLAVWQLRPAFRRLEGGADRPGTGRRMRFPRPKLRNAPILWKECFTSPKRGVVQWLTLALVLFLFGLVALITYQISRDLILYLLDGGGAWSPTLIRDQQLYENMYLRYLTAFLYGVSGLLVAGAGATSVTTERERDTWDGLLVTILTPTEIVLQKMLGAVWQQRWLTVVIVAHLALGVLVGALSIAGVILGMLEAAVFLAFAAAVGVRSSLFAKSTSQASGWAGGILMASGAIGPLVARAFKWKSILFWAGCAPAVLMFTLVEPLDLQQDLGASNIDSLHRLGFDADEPWGYAVAACILGTQFYAVAAVAFTWSAIRGFDRAVGRPMRPPAAEPAPQAPTPVLRPAAD